LKNIPDIHISPLDYGRLEKPVRAKHEKNTANLTTSLPPTQKETIQQCFPNFFWWRTICGYHATNVFHLAPWNLILLNIIRS